MKPLTLGELEGKTLLELRAYITERFQVPASIVTPYTILIAHEWDGGYEQTNWFLLRKGKQLFENHGSHCSCYDFEDQWKPEPTTLKYLKSDQFHFSCGDEHVAIAQAWIREHL